MSSQPIHSRSALGVRFGAATITTLLTLSNLAGAQEVDEFGSYGAPDRPRGSAQDFALELRVGPYLPRVDSEFDDKTEPFKRYFGTTNRVALGAEFDWLPLKIDGILRFGPGVGIMYTTVGADAFFHDFPEDRAKGERTSIRVMPHWATAVMRFDALAKKASIPLVLTAKLGVAHALWWVNDQPRTAPAADGTEGRGRSYGVYYALGAHLDLGFLDTQRKKRLDSFIGINSIYFFGEFYGLELDGFGASDVMNVGDRSWVLGLAFDL